MTDESSTPSSETTPPDAGRAGSHRPRRRRRWLGVVLVLLVAGGVLGFLTLKQANSARTRLEEARAAMEAGRAQLVAGDLIGAEDSFVAAEDAFADGLERARHPLIRIAGYLPWIGRTPDAVDTMARAGILVAQAARETTAAVNELPGGLGDLAPQAGALPIDLLAEMEEPLERARDLINRAVDLLEETETSLLLGPVATAREELAVELPQADRTIEAAAALARELPAFLGADGTRRYFFGAQNPAELRGTGGLIGAYSIMTVRDGKLSLGPFLPIQSLPDRLGRKDAPPPPNPDFDDRYKRFGGQTFWLNINMTGDFPSAAEAIENLYEEVRGERLDGVILADPFAYSALLSVTGPVDVPTAGTAIAAETAVAFLSNEAYVTFPDPNIRKAVLGETARVVLERFLQEGASANPVGAARTLLQTAANGNLLLHSAEAEEQEAFETAGIAGQLREVDGDYLGVFSNNAAANKVDYYLDTTIRHHVELNGDGSSEAQTFVEYRNSAPTEGLPEYVIGPFDPRFVAGENRTYVSTYYAPGSRLESFRAPGEVIEVIGSQEELGHPVFSTFVRTESGGTSRLEFNSTLEDAWEDVKGSGRYTLMYQGQNTIRPTQVELAIELPAGASLISSSPPFTPEGDRVVWRGVPGQELRFELAFESAGISPLAIAVLAGLGLLLAGLMTLWVLRGRMVRRTRPSA